MIVFFLILLFILWLSFWSFWSVLLTRLEDPTRKNIKSIFTGRSHCPHCQQTLKRHQLIPLYSYLKQKRKCWHCHTPIPSRYFRTEILCWLIFVVTAIVILPLCEGGGCKPGVFLYVNLPLSFRLLTNRLLTLLAIYDFRKQLLHIPIRTILTSLIIIAYSLSLRGSGATTAIHISQIIISTLIRTLGFLLIYRGAKLYTSKKYNMSEWFGQGDVMLAFTIGLLIPRIHLFQSFALSPFNLFTIFFLFIILSSVIGLFQYGIVTFVLRRWLLDIRRSSLLIPHIPSLPAMILALRILLIFWDKILSLTIK